MGRHRIYNVHCVNKKDCHQENICEKRFVSKLDSLFFVNIKQMTFLKTYMGV